MISERRSGWSKGNLPATGIDWYCLCTGVLVCEQHEIYENIYPGMHVARTRRWCGG